MITFKQTERFSRPYWLRLAGFTVTLVTLAAVGLLAYFIKIQVDAFVTPRRNTALGDPTVLNRPYQDILLTTSDGVTIAGWYMTGTRPQAIILVHGIDANRSAVLPEAAFLAEAGFHLVMIDLRAHGHSGGSQASYGYREALDVQAAVDYLATRSDIEQIGALGTSFGGAAVVRAAANDPRLQAIVVESSYSSLPDAVEDAFEQRSIFPKWPFASLLVSLAERRVGLNISQIDSARDLATIHPRPVLIIHGTADQLFPPHHAKKMYATAREPKDLWMIDGLGHANPVPGNEAEFKARVVTFFENALMP